MQRKLIVFTLAAALTGNALAVGAQERERKIVVEPVQEEFFITQAPAAGAPPRPVEIIRGDNLIFMATEMSFAGKLVKGAPYSAQAVTETVQALADGNRIVRKNTAQVYRDSEGRTRRDQTLGHIGPYATAGDVPQTIFINDPVAAVHYILDPAKKTARKLPRTEMRFKVEGGAAQGLQPARQGAVQEKLELERHFVLERTPGAEVVHGPGVVPPPPPAPAVAVPHVPEDTKIEKLEARTFDGVRAEGERTTTTIPAGKIGNEQPIELVDERWYSPELQVVVMTRHSDPRSGETTYRLTNISRTEPAAALFQVPSDYVVKETPVPGSGVRRMRRPAPPPPPQQPQEN